MIDSTYNDEWISEHYPNAMYFTDSSGEVYVALGVDIHGNSHY